MNKAVFLDRDGTIIEEKNYLSDIKDIIFMNKAIEGLKHLQEKYLLIIITNQSGVARGYFTEEKVIEINSELKKRLTDNGVTIKDVFHCPHLVDGIVKEYSFDCNCRKPKTGLIEKAKELYNIDLSESFVIGDKDTDIELGNNCNCKTILIENKNYKNLINPNYIAKDLLDASNYIFDLESSEK